MHTRDKTPHEKLKSKSRRTEAERHEIPRMGGAVRAAVVLICDSGKTENETSFTLDRSVFDSGVCLVGHPK